MLSIFFSFKFLILYLPLLLVHGVQVSETLQFCKIYIFVKNETTHCKLKFISSTGPTADYTRQIGTVHDTKYIILFVQKRSITVVGYHINTML